MRGLFSEEYVAAPMPETALESYLAPMHRPDIDRAVRALYRGMVLPEAMRLFRGIYRRQRLTVPTRIVVGRRDVGLSEELVERICRNPERHADHIEFSYVDDASHFITDDAPGAVAALALDWFDRAA